MEIWERGKASSGNVIILGLPLVRVAHPDNK